MNRRAFILALGGAAAWPLAMLTAALPTPLRNSRRLVCLESSILKGDGGRFTTPPPSRSEARSRLG